MDTTDQENTGEDQNQPENQADAENQSPVQETEQPTYRQEPPKKKGKRKVLWIILLMIPVVGALGAYQFFVEEKAPRINPLHLIPKNAMFVLETDEPFKAWKSISKTSIWSSLKKDDEWAELGEQLEDLNKSLSAYESIIDIIGNRTVYVSGHPYRRSDHDYLIIVDTDGIPAFQKWVTTLGTTTKRKYKEETIFEMLDQGSKETFYYTILDGFLVGSYTYSLVESSISDKEEPELSRSYEFLDVRKSVLGEGLLRLYLNYQASYPYLSDWQGKELMDPIAENLPFYFSGLYFDIEKESLFLKGKSNYIDSVSTYFTIFPESGEGDFEVAEVLPARTAALYSFAFDSFEDFYNALEEKLKADSEYGEDYDSYKKRIENFLDIDLREDFVNWLSDELAVIQLESEAKNPEPQAAFILKAKSNLEATEKMNFLTRQIKRKTPVKFKLIDYKGYPINFMSIKGFFKLILGKLFDRFDKPYYTIIDKYVVFANEPQVLRRIIDDYVNGNTLQKQKPFQAFVDRLDDEHSALIYMQLPLLHGSMRDLASSTFLKYLRESKGLLEDFPQIAMQVSPSGDMLDTRVLLSQKIFILPDPTGFDVPFVADTVNYDSLFKLGVGEQIEIAEVVIEDLNAKKQTEEFDGGQTKYEVGVKDGLKHGNYYEYYDTGELKVKGKYKSDLKEGTWKYYDENGDLIKREKYRKGELVN
ncbi:MAG: DUF3352 domain-containing protein [Bacteroidota bacterium]